MKLSRILVSVFFLVIGVAIGGYFYLEHQFQIPHTRAGGAQIIEIPHGSGTRDVVRLLRDHDIISNELVAFGYLAFSGGRRKLQAGEYLFDKPMTVAEVIERIANGRIYLHKFTVPEGLTIKETALKWEEQGFGPAAEFIGAAKDSVPLVYDLDSNAKTLEGYLFPETYSFPIRTTPRQAIEAMVARFHEVIGKLWHSYPSEGQPQFSQTVILASIVESEAAVNDERPVIASVYQNRLNKRMLLQCDTTVIYALERENRYRGTLTLKDLKFDSRYNTYVYPGLPPSPITNPGYQSLVAAFNPATTKFIYFVRTTGGRHKFSETLSEHNRAVAEYRAMHH